MNPEPLNPQPSTPCVCPNAGWCATHGRMMSEIRHNECRNKPGYFEVFQKDAAKRKAAMDPEQLQKLSQGNWRKAKVRTSAVSGQRSAVRKPPGLFRRAMTFLRAVWRWAKAGFPLAEWKETRRRRDICHACEHRTPEGVCRACGCLIKAKARIATESCPLGKWGEPQVQRSAISGQRSEKTCGTCGAAKPPVSHPRTPAPPHPATPQLGPFQQFITDLRASVQLNPDADWYLAQGRELPAAHAHQILGHPLTSFADPKCWQHDRPATERDDVDGFLEAVGPLTIPPPLTDARRNLIYYIWPYALSNLWQHNLDELLARWDLFNGSRTIAVATDNDTVTADEVERYIASRLPTSDFRLLTYANRKSLGETVAFSDLLSAVASIDPRDVTFYAHAKGVTPKPSQAQSWQWARTMYETLLDYWPLVERNLQHFNLVGAFRHRGNSFAGWHFPGTFFWFRNCDIFSRPSREIQAKRNTMAVELWPTKFPIAQSCPLLHDQTGGIPYYEPEFWKRRNRQMESFRRRNLLMKIP